MGQSSYLQRERQHCHRLPRGLLLLQAPSQMACRAFQQDPRRESVSSAILDRYHRKARQQPPQGTTDTILSSACRLDRPVVAVVAVHSAPEAAEVGLPVLEVDLAIGEPWEDQPICHPMRDPTHQAAQMLATSVPSPRHPLEALPIIKSRLDPDQIQMLPSHLKRFPVDQVESLARASLQNSVKRSKKRSAPARFTILKEQARSFRHLRAKVDLARRRHLQTFD